MELALITVSAKGSAQDEASSIVATAGGRLVALDDDRFTAQLTDRTEKIDALLDRLRQIAAIESVRSGSLSIRAT
jgi:acetolactate synthase small subunit